MSSNYLKNASAPNAVQSWKSFLERLGIRDGIAITKFNETIFEVSFSCINGLGCKCIMGGWCV